MRTFKADYDKTNDNLFLYYPRKKSSGSVEFGDIVLDFDDEDNVVGIELFDASVLIKAASFRNDVKITRSLLDRMRSSKMNFKRKGSNIVIKCILSSDKGLDIPVSIIAPMTIDERVLITV